MLPFVRLPLPPLWAAALHKLFRIALLVLLVYMLVMQAQSHLDNQKANAFLHPEAPLAQFGYLALVVLLLPLNLAIETLKWQRLTHHITPLSFKQALRGVLYGMSIGVATPNRIGELGGRALALPNQQRWRGIGAAAIGNISQLLATLVLSGIGISFFLPLYGTQIHPFIAQHQHAIPVFLTGYWAILLVAHLIYFFSRPRLVFRSSPTTHRWTKYLADWQDIFATYSSADLWMLLLLSYARTCIFTLQYLAMYGAVGIGAPVGLLAAATLSLFWLQTLLPTITLAEAGIRGNCALFLLLPIAPNALAILTATLGIWVINLLLPAAFGSYMLVRREANINTPFFHRITSRLKRLRN